VLIFFKKLRYSVFLNIFALFAYTVFLFSMELYNIINVNANFSGNSIFNMLYLTFFAIYLILMLFCLFYDLYLIYKHKPQKS